MDEKDKKKPEESSAPIKPKPSKGDNMKKGLKPKPNKGVLLTERDQS